MSYPREFCFTVLTIVNLCLFYGTYLNLSSNEEESQLVTLKTESLTLTTNTLKIIRRQERCLLQIPDPWDPTIRHLFPNVTFDYAAPRLLKGSPLVTTFTNGVLQIINVSYSCKYRCFQLEKSDKQKFEPYIDFQVQANVSCEFVDVSCGKSNGNKSDNSSFIETYRMPYAQGVKIKNYTERMQNESYRPSVIVIIIDSLSHSSAKRRLSRSVQYLKDHLNLTVFDGYAKVGLNSNPNGMAFLTGKMKEAVYEKQGDAGGNGAAKEQSIWNDFKKHGYVTFYSEDDPINFLFDRFGTAPTDHFFGPFWTHSNSIRASPQASHRVGLSYLNQLLKIYQNNPLFALLWVSALSHEQVNDLDDDGFLEFFRKSKDLLKDSFVIFMGDHGMRFGELRSSAPGRLEDMLPFFSIAVPEVLRNRLDINQNLKENSKILTNHYDLYVTFWDLMTSNFRLPISHQLKWSNFTKAVRGLSLIRPIPSNRTCHSLQTPLEYCPCFELTKNCTDMTLRNYLAQFAVQTMNNIIRNRRCEVMFVEKILDVEELIEQASNDSDVYRILLTTVPNSGTFQAVLRRNRLTGNIANAATLIDRINRYGNMSACEINYTIKR